MEGYVTTLCAIWVGCGLFNVLDYVRLERTHPKDTVSVEVCLVVFLLGPLATVAILLE